MDQLSTGTVVERLSWVVERLVRRLRAVSAGEGLSPSAVSMMSSIDHQGPSRVTDLGRQLGISQPAATQLVTRLVADGLAERTASEADRRAVVVDLTDAGRESIAARRRRRAAALDALLDELDADDRAALETAVGALERLVETAERSTDPAD